MEYKEKTLSSETLYAGRVVSLTKDAVELPDGRRSTREIVHHNGGACIAAIDEAGEVTLVRQYRYAFSQELLELPAGKLERGEDPFSAAKRELEEETGLVAQEYIDLGPFYPTVGYSTEVIYCYAAKGLSCGAEHPDSGEFLSVCTYPLDTLLCMIEEGKIRDGKTVVSLLKLKRLREQGRF